MENSPEPQVVPPDDVRAQLERILASNVFANAGRMSRLLRYVVERTMGGDGSQLKEYVLGTDVFDRGESYDPRLDSIVRIEARQLRARLDEYYRGPGAEDPVVITIPRGSYAPVFSPSPGVPGGKSAHQAPAPLAPPEAGPPQARSIRSAALLGIVGVGLAAMLLAAAVSWRPGTPAARASTAPSIAVLPFQHYSTDGADGMTAARLTDSVTTELARLGTLSVVSRTTLSRYAGDLRPAREIARDLDADFLMESTITRDGGRIRVVTRLVNGELDRKIWVGEYEGAASEIEALSRRIATESAAGALTYLSRR